MDDLVWDELELDQSCPSNHGMQMWISRDGEYAKKGSSLSGEWREVVYRISKNEHVISGMGVDCKST